MSMTDVAVATNTLCFVKAETAVGTLVKPTPTDAVFILGDVSLPWEREILDDEQHRNSPSRTTLLAGRYNPASYSIETYIKPSGTAGTPPEVKTLLTSALGSYLNTPATSDAFSLATALPSFSLYVKNDHTMFAISGATVNELRAIVNGTQFGRLRFSGQGIRKYWAGTAKVVSAASGQKSIVVESGGAKRYTVGMHINVGADTNTGAGYLIDSVTPGTDTLTVTTNLASGAANTEYVTPWAPTPTEVGAPVFGKLGMATKGGTNLPILSAEVSLNNNLKYYVDEKNNTLYTSEYGRPGKRIVTVDLTLYYYKEHASFFYEQEAQTKSALVIPVGSAAGSIMTIYCPTSGASGAGVILNNPDISGTEEKQIKVTGECLANSSYNNELSIIFT